MQSNYTIDAQKTQQKDNPKKGRRIIQEKFEKALIFSSLFDIIIKNDEKEEIPMKRLTALALLIILCLGMFAGCGESKDTIICRDCNTEIKKDDSYVRKGHYYCMDCFYGEVK